MTSLSEPNSTRLRGGSLCIAWKSECFRSLQTAHILRAPLALVRPKSRKGALGTLVRYALSSLQTIKLLAGRRPRLVAVLNQPPPLAIIAALYARLTGAKLVLDAHSKPFAAARDSLYGRIYRWVTRTATLTINHNDKDQAVAQAWGAPNSVVLEALPYVLPVEAGQPAKNGVYVVCVCSFAEDEPIDVILEAARALAPLDIRITGDWRKSGLALEDLPANLTPTGFLPTQEYYDLLIGAAAVITLSTRDWIMQMAVEESLLIGVPVVTNYSPVLQKVLGEGAAFTTLNTASLAAAVRRVVDENDRYRTAIRQAAEALRNRVDARMAEVRPILST